MIHKLKVFTISAAAILQKHVGQYSNEAIFNFILAHT